MKFKPIVLADPVDPSTAMVLIVLIVLADLVEHRHLPITIVTKSQTAESESECVSCLTRTVNLLLDWFVFH